MRDFDIIHAEQRSPEWFAARAGRLTGSVASEMLARTKTGWSTSRRNLALRLVLERITGKPQERDFQSAAMQAGIEREPLAFAAFEALTGDVVERSGFLAHRSVMAGCSLDGHIGDFGELLSIKCRQPAAHLEFLKSGAIPLDALIQMRHEMWITGAGVHHYFSYNPDFPPSMQSRLVTIHRSVDVEDYAEQAVIFLAEVAYEYEALLTMADPVARMREVIA